MPTSLQPPGVYINEINAFPNSVVPVATAIPAFIGYTARASYQGKSYVGRPSRIESFAQYLTIFGALDAAGQPAEADAQAQYSPRYWPVLVAKSAAADVAIGGKFYALMADPTSIYYLYNSVRLFYANGGGTCYVVSVGGYGPVAGSPASTTAAVVNPNVRLADLLQGLAALEKEDEPTLIVVPEATLLVAADNQTLNRAVLAHCASLQSRIGIFDVPGAAVPDPLAWKNDIASFRAAIGEQSLNYGAAYYPFLNTSVVLADTVDFRSLGEPKVLAAVLPDATTAPVNAIIARIDQAAAEGEAAVMQAEFTLRNVSPAYKQLHRVLLNKIRVLPPSGAMAGIYTVVDNSQGVWHAPANVDVASVTDVTVKLTDAMQAGLNVDAATGKSINAIRLLPGKGVIVWGARTLDGNSEDWRYVNVRRTLIMIEQSIKLAANAYVFQPNVANTWSLVSSMITNFLTTLWTEGALVGATPAAAFSVAVGLGSTMTAQDILDGVMNVSVKVAVSHPAEFIVITFQQQMQAS